jgi:hypothetical protein
VSEELIQVEVVRSGGFAGLSRTARVGSANLDEQRAATLRSLVSEASLSGQTPQASRAPGGADRFQYEVTLVRGGDGVQSCCPIPISRKRTGASSAGCWRRPLHRMNPRSAHDDPLAVLVPGAA